MSDSQGPQNRVLLTSEFDTSAILKGANDAAAQIEAKIGAAAAAAEASLKAASQRGGAAMAANLGGVSRGIYETVNAIGTAAPAAYDRASAAATKTAAATKGTRTEMAGLGPAVAIASGAFATFGDKVPPAVFGVTSALARLLSGGLGPVSIAVAGLAVAGAALAAQYETKIPSAFDVTKDKLVSMRQEAERARVELTLLRKLERSPTSGEVDVAGTEAEESRRRKALFEAQRAGRLGTDLEGFLRNSFGGPYSLLGDVFGFQNEEQQKAAAVKEAQDALRVLRERVAITTEVDQREKSITRSIEKQKADFEAIVEQRRAVRDLQRSADDTFTAGAQANRDRAYALDNLGQSPQERAAAQARFRLADLREQFAQARRRNEADAAQAALDVTPQAKGESLDAFMARQAKARKDVEIAGQRELQDLASKIALQDQFVGILDREVTVHKTIAQLTLEAERRQNDQLGQERTIAVESLRRRAEIAGMPSDRAREIALQAEDAAAALKTQESRVAAAREELTVAEKRSDLSTDDVAKVREHVRAEEEALRILRLELDATKDLNDADRERLDNSLSESRAEQVRADARAIANRRLELAAMTDPALAERAPIILQERKVAAVREELRIAEDLGRASTDQLERMREGVSLEERQLALVKLEVEQRRRAEFVAIGQAGASTFLDGIREGLSEGNVKPMLEGFRAALTDVVLDAFLAATLKKPLESLFGSLASSVGGFFGAVKGGGGGEGDGGSGEGPIDVGIDTSEVVASGVRAAKVAREPAVNVVVDMSGAADSIARRMSADGSRTVVVKANEGRGLPSRKGG